MGFEPIDTEHDDLIHDCSYDFYGQRLMTCSSDRSLKVFDYNDATHKWDLSDSWKCADGTILKCVWAHPEHGQVVACASVDRTVRIFEEQEQEKKRSGKRWVERARLVDARAAVHDIWFAPSHQGLRLASIAADGIVRIYEALEPNNLSHWTLMDDFSVIDTPVPKETEASFCLTWCPSRFATPTIVVGAMEKVRLYSQDNAGKWRPGVEILHGGLVRDISWAASMGRTYHLLATACKDGHVRIFKLQEKEVGDGAGSDMEVIEEHQVWTYEKIGDFDDHKAQVWRVSFNVTGTILSSAGDDARIRLWKSAGGVNGARWGSVNIASMEKASVMQE
ncbi:Nucleoporin seh1 [Taphrina deformans PYCC 5710]|uniref:Nucleoporin seh1 n=1 Tax=Taphrina deformans (strain PYCC 5710 / ATCC 11124 / CBS 356.35 / IMI 108563 / JCM 9778 / NBRC 8474) TaxID=1097556 RepID=R4X6U9_TAPDE|nr:Nucleoporin seh1 [Taphrina deformans PYCC 5710]|eukprot:CCG80941.1 Nucleoporin seh1 [Taphrina deformans PYCC 5710]